MALRASFTLVAALYIAPADLQQLCGFQLGQRRLTGQAIPQQDQLPFPRRQPFDELPQPPGLVLLLTAVLHAEAVLQHVREGQCRVVLARLQRFLQRHGGPAFPLPPEVHPKLICYPLPSALWDGKENPHLSRNNASTSKWNFLSRESGSFFLLQRVSCEGCGLTSQPNKHPLLGKRTKDHPSEVLLPSGGKPWFRFSIYASHVRYGNFSPAKRKSSSASHDMWQRRRAFVMESF